MARDILLLLALPAAGKSEIRTYLDSLDGDALADLGFGPQVQLDDYPYVHLMRRISQEQRARGLAPSFFADDASQMLEPRDWGTLIHLLNEDYAALEGTPVAGTVLERFDRARAAAGAAPATAGMDAAARAEIEAAVAGEAPPPPQPAAPGSTVVVEFARGGPEGASMPLPAPLGYRYALACLDPGLLRRAAILYVWVTPAESRRRNRDRAAPGPEGDASILHHGVPEVVMRGDYGTDDLGWLLETSGTPGAVAVERDGERFEIPTARFDNRTDLTSFLRGDPASWPSDAVALVHGRLREALRPLREG
ncbi:MAG: hypothetical protein KQH83_05570 [Actinobacteria bacterium]|nr:hypothetical protein [Actinomycetota bacterium]